MSISERFFPQSLCYQNSYFLLFFCFLNIFFVVLLRSIIEMLQHFILGRTWCLLTPLAYSLAQNVNLQKKKKSHSKTVISLLFYTITSQRKWPFFFVSGNETQRRQIFPALQPLVSMNKMYNSFSSTSFHTGVLCFLASAHCLLGDGSHCQRVCETKNQDRIY